MKRSRSLPFRSFCLDKAEIDEVFMYYDVARVFSCRTPTGVAFLAYWADELYVDDGEGYDGDQWMAVKLSDVRLEQLRVGDISMREALTDPEDGRILFIDAPDRKDCSERWVKPEELEKDYFPDASCRLSLEPRA